MGIGRVQVLVCAIDEHTREDEKREEKVQRSAETTQTSPVLGQTRDLIVKLLEHRGLRKARECDAFVDDLALHLMVIAMDQANLEESSMADYIHKIYLLYNDGFPPRSLVSETSTMDGSALQKWFKDVDHRNKQKGDSDSTRTVKFYAVKKLLEANGVEEVDHVKPAFKKVRVEFEDTTPTKEDVQRMLITCENTKQRILVRLIFQCFVRIESVHQLSFGDVWGALEGKKAVAIRIEAKKSKCRVSHRIVIPPEVCELIRLHKAEVESKGCTVTRQTPLIGCDRDPGPGKRMSWFGTDNLARDIMRKADVRGKPELKANGVIRYKKRVHSSRKFCRLEWKRNKGDAEAAQYLLGHKTDRYLQLEDTSDEELIGEYLAHYPRIFEDDEAMNHAVDHAINELRSLGLPQELCSKISQLLKEKARGDGETGLPGNGCDYGS